MLMDSGRGEMGDGVTALRNELAVLLTSLGTFHGCKEGFVGWELADAGRARWARALKRSRSSSLSLGDLDKANFILSKS